MLTLGQAAREVGKTKTALANAIKSGRVSATRDDKGQYQIDPAELFRVYPKKSPEVGETRPQETLVLHCEIELLREQLTREQETNRRLFDRLDAEGEERRKLTALLTHQPTPPEAEDQRPAPKRSDERLGLLWSALTVLVWVAMLGAVAFGLAVWWPSLNQQ